jgi:hypothetical protein
VNDATRASFPPKDICWWCEEKEDIVGRVAALESACDQLAIALTELKGDIRVLAVRIGGLATIGAIVGGGAVSLVVRHLPGGGG